MSSLRLKEKLSSVVASQLPEHIRTEYPTFVKFIEAYYEFLEQDQSAQEVIQNSLHYSDVDRSLTSFIEYFLKQYAPDIPRSALADKKLLIKRIQDLYYSKGSVKAYELLFRILYNSKPEITFPGDYILKASDGVWSQRTTVFIQRLAGISESIIDKGVTLSNNNKRTFLRLKSRYPVYELIGGARTPIDDVYEYEFDNSTNVNIEVGDIVTTPTFRGVVLSSPVGVSIVNPGSGFTQGKIFNININGATGVQLKVTTVNNNGGITGAEIINYGSFYPDTFYYDLAPFTNYNLTERSIVVKDGSTYEVQITTQACGIEDSGILETLSGQESEFTYSPLLAFTQGTQSSALLKFTGGAKIFYPGYYKETGGFLSDEYKLQDRDYYQPYSYLVRAEQQLSEFKDTILNIIHPAGLKIHGEYVLQGIFNYNIIAETGFGLNLNAFSDIAIAFDLSQAFSIDKILPSEGVVPSFVYRQTITKTLPTLTSTQQDNGFINNPIKYFYSNSSIQETSIVIENTSGYISYVTHDDLSLFFDSTKGISLQVVPSDSNYITSVQKYESSNTSVDDQSYSNEITIIPPSFISDYTDAGYFLQDYTSTFVNYEGQPVVDYDFNYTLN